MLAAQAVVEDEYRLIALAQSGDREAYGELVRRYRCPLIRMLYHLCGEAHLAEDAAQTAFIRAWQHLDHLQPRTSFRNWLYRIAANAAFDAIRREKPQDSIEDLELAAPGERMEAGVERRERQECVRQAVLALPEASRAVLVLREYERLSYQEIAATLEIPLGTVMSRLNYARKRLLETLREDLEEK